MRLVVFASQKGWRCGNSFIAQRSKCYTHSSFIPRQPEAGMDVGIPACLAKFFRDSGLNKQDIDKKGIPLREKIATDGLALSELSDSLFNKVIQGEISEGRGVVIGSTVKDKLQQEELVKLIDREEKRGKKITNETVAELADMVTTTPTVKEESGGGLFDLLGFTPTERSTAIEKAQLQASIKRQLSREKKLFGTVGKSRAASELERGDNRINVEKSAELSEDATKALTAFEQEKNLSGSVSRLLNDGATRLANGENVKKVEKELYERIFEELSKTYKFGEKERAKRVTDISEKRREKKYMVAHKQQNLAEFNSNVYYYQNRNGKRVKVIKNRHGIKGTATGDIGSAYVRAGGAIRKDSRDIEPQIKIKVKRKSVRAYVQGEIAGHRVQG
ncbi:MAG: hypothetical protein ACRC2V_03080, partial [Xenococcaceae cyanobacterium]